MSSKAVFSGAEVLARGAPESSEGERSEAERDAGAPRAKRGSPEPSADAEVRVRRRRAFKAEYKAAILREVDACTEPGQVGALLRRESLYSSHLTHWRQQRDASVLSGLAVRKRGPKGKSAETKQVEQLERENAKLVEELRKARIIIEFQKKVHALLGIPLPDVPDSEKP
jgi:transposase-like protein